MVFERQGQKRAMIQRLLEHFTYAALFGLLVGAGVGLPFPEEVTQLTAGVLARTGRIAFWPGVAVTYGGILLGDYLLFRLGRRHGTRVLESPAIARLLTPSRRRFIEEHFSRHAFLTIMVARHASGFRLPTFALAGLSGVSSGTFLLADGLSALVSVPLVVGLGWLFAHNLEVARKDLRELEIAVVVLVAASVAATWLWRRRRRKPPSS